MHGRAARAHRCAAALAAAACVLVGGCALPRPAPSPPAPKLTPSPSVTPAFPVPTVRERMVLLARQEWQLFGAPVIETSDDGAPRLVYQQPAGALDELQAPGLTRVLMYWYAVSPAPIVGHAGELRPWSAAFVAWLARSAGLTAGEFPATVLHWDYIARFLRADDTDRFATRDPERHAPQVGDLVCHARAGSLDRLADDAGPQGATAPPAPATTPPPVRGFADLRRGPYHCDLVVGSNDGAIETIGGNVADTVALRRIPLAPDGRLAPREGGPWVAVIEQRDR